MSVASPPLIFTLSWSVYGQLDFLFLLWILVYILFLYFGTKRFFSTIKYRNCRIRNKQLTIRHNFIKQLMQLWICLEFLCLCILCSHDRALWHIKMNKTNRCNEFQLYWYDDSTRFGQPFCPSSGVLSRTSALVHYMQLWWTYATRSRKERQFLPTPGSKRSPQLHIMYQGRCTAQNSWWWAERLPETCRVVITIKLEFSASVGFIHFNRFA